ADRLGQQMMPQQRDAVILSSDLFATYLQFYACLGRPDITQQAFSRVKRQWRQPTTAVYGALQLALLRFSADQATGGHLLRKTAIPGQNAQQLADKIHHRLAYPSVEAVVCDATNQAQRSRRLVKLLEYGSYVALGALVAKWLWIGNSVLLAGFGVVPKALASVAAVIIASVSVRWALRRSVMGSLTTPTLLPGNANTGKRFAYNWRLGSKMRSPEALRDVLPASSDSEARRILRRAFPASPSDDAMLEINEMLYGTFGVLYQPRLSWKLQLALTWSNFARRFAVVEPMLITTHEMNLQLAKSWLRGLVQMFCLPLPDTADREAREYRQKSASSALQEFMCFVWTNFSTVPLGLAHTDISALASFAAQEASTSCFAEFLRLVGSGCLGLVRGPELPAVSSNSGARVKTDQQAGTTLGSDEVYKHRAGAMVLAYITSIQRISRTCHSRPDDIQHSKEMLTTALNYLQSDLSMPTSASLYCAAFAAADRVLDDAVAASQRLADSLEARFLAHDPFVVHILNPTHGTANQGVSVGWKLRGNSSSEPAKNLPIVNCISPYIAMLARKSASNCATKFTPDALVTGLVERWTGLGILSPTSAVQCLILAVQSLPALNDATIAARLAESWAARACRYADNLADTAQSLDHMLLLSLKLCGSADCLHPHGAQILAVWQDAASRLPELKHHSSPDFNALAVESLAALALKPTAHSPASKENVRMALCVMSQMRYSGQSDISTLALGRLSRAAEHAGMDISEATEKWPRAPKQHTKNKAMSAFAKTLF
ncbi:hypothetical protein GGI04_003450, partial [Coemansia thaxteri]